MIDLSKITYRAIISDGFGRQHNVEEFIENLGWEENENEISVRLSFTVRNHKIAKEYLSGLITPGCLVGVFASDGGLLDQEVARGYVEKWNAVRQNDGSTLKCTCYDELYRLQKSQENMYFPSGTGTQSAINGILDGCGIRKGDYRGPNATHGKLKFNNNYLSDVILELLDDAAKKGQGKYLIRSAGGETCVLPRGSNETVYVFDSENTVSVSETLDISNLVTRVKVIGQAEDEGKSSAEASLDGLTQYGVRQRIYTRGSDESIQDAKSAAQEILNEKGNMIRGLSVQSPDVPWVRKGDLVYLMAGIATGYFYVKSIRHDADTCRMTMDVEAAEQEIVSNQNVVPEKSYEVGDVVNFHGGTHYFSSYPGARGYAAGAGPAKITQKDGSGKAHPWHLIHTDGSSNVYGWVDDGTFD